MQIVELAKDTIQGCKKRNLCLLFQTDSLQKEMNVHMATPKRESMHGIDKVFILFFLGG